MEPTEHIALGFGTVVCIKYEKGEEWTTWIGIDQNGHAITRLLTPEEINHHRSKLSNAIQPEGCPYLEVNDIESWVAGTDG